MSARYVVTTGTPYYPITPVQAPFATYPIQTAPVQEAFHHLRSMSTHSRREQLPRDVVEVRRHLDDALDSLQGVKERFDDRELNAGLGQARIDLQEIPKRLDAAYKKTKDGIKTSLSQLQWFDDGQSRFSMTSGPKVFHKRHQAHLANPTKVPRPGTPDFLKGDFAEQEIRRRAEHADPQLRDDRHQLERAREFEPIIQAQDAISKLMETATTAINTAKTHVHNLPLPRR